MKLTQRPLSEAEQKRLRSWLLDPACTTLLRIVESDALAAEQQSIETQMEDPVAIIRGDEMPDKVHDLNRKAAIYRLFLSTFSEIVGREEFAIHSIYGSGRDEGRPANA